MELDPFSTCCLEIWFTVQTFTISELSSVLDQEVNACMELVCLWILVVCVCGCVHVYIIYYWKPTIHFIQEVCVYAILLCLSSMQCCIISCILFTTGALTEERNEKEATPLMYACAFGQTELVQLLIAHGESQL